jgi:hypothetical protein
VSFHDQVRSMKNADLAKALEYIASTMRGGISDSILTEAAKRIRNQPDPFLVTPPEPELPPLEDEAVPEPEATPFGLRMDAISRKAIEKVYQ